jgi:hypothetical protein
MALITGASIESNLRRRGSAGKPLGDAPATGASVQVSWSFHVAETDTSAAA